MNVTRIATRLAASVVLAAATIAVAAPPASAAEPTTPGATVVAQNPFHPGRASAMGLTLVAHSAASTSEAPSCRPEDATLRCWGYLTLRLPAFGGMTVRGLEVHRLTVGSTGCSGEDEGGCGHDAALTATYKGTEAQVNGLSRITVPGRSGLPVGTQVQVQIALHDNGARPYADTVDVQINRFVAGSVKPLIYDSGEQTVQQVWIHVQRH